MQVLAIVALCIGAAVVYGIAHDQITARICVEYFTIGHPPVFATDDPTLLGLGWGVIATWWVGLMLGIFLALAARAGRRPPRDRPIAWFCSPLSARGAAMSFHGRGMDQQLGGWALSACQGMKRLRPHALRDGPRSRAQRPIPTIGTITSRRRSHAPSMHTMTP